MSVFDELNNNGDAAFNQLQGSVSTSFPSSFQDSPFGEDWSKNLHEWAQPVFSKANILQKGKLKLIDNTFFYTHSNIDTYVRLTKDLPFIITIYADTDGLKTLSDYNGAIQKTIGANEIKIFVELKDNKIDLGRIVRVRLGSNVIEELRNRWFEIDVSPSELSDFIIKRIKGVKNLSDKNEEAFQNELVASDDVRTLLVKAIKQEYNNKQFDEVSWFQYFLKVSNLNIDTWLFEFSGWLRSKKYKDEKYWDGLLPEDKYTPAFLPKILLQSKDKKEESIHAFLNSPFVNLEEAIAPFILKNKFIPKGVSKLFFDYLEKIKNQNKKYADRIAELLVIDEFYVERLKHFNAFYVGLWNGILELIAGLIDLVALLIIYSKGELGFKMTDQLWEAFEKLFNEAIYKTESFLEKLFEKFIALSVKIDKWYGTLETNSYARYKLAGELVPIIVESLIAWLKGAKIKKAANLTKALTETTEEVAEQFTEKTAKEAKEKLLNESVEKNADNGKKVAEEQLGEVSKEIEDVADKSAIRNQLVKDVPGIKLFNKWFNDLTPDELDLIWRDVKSRNKVKARLRHPGGLHEWLMVSRANVFKRWGVSSELIKSLRTKIDEVIFKNPAGYHGGPGSTKAHNEILNLIDNSKSYDEFKFKLLNWAENRLEGGQDSLPKGFFE